MSFVHQVLFTLRTLIQDEPESSRVRRRRNNNRSKEKKGNNRSKQAVTLVITFGDLFASDGLNFLLDTKDAFAIGRKANVSSLSPASNGDPLTSVSTLRNPRYNNKSKSYAEKFDDVESKALTTRFSGVLQNCSEEEIPLLCEEMNETKHSLSYLSSPTSMLMKSMLENIIMADYNRRSKRSENLTVSLTHDDENKNVETFRKVLKWSPNKRRSASFAVPLPKGEEHKAIVVVQNAVNRVKEEQLQKRGCKFLCLRCR